VDEVSLMPKRQTKKVVDLTTGVVGLGVASAASATLPGMAGTIVRGGTLPIAGVSMMGMAADYGSRPRRAKRRRRR
jgi:hypothetical protein